MGLEVTGHVQTRFIEAAALLHLLDPVRGEPIAHGLDLEGDGMEVPRDRLLKRKFLDSFALICAVRKDGDTVSAASMEEGMPEGTVIRVASNRGLSESTLNQIRGMTDILNNVANEAFEKNNRETELLSKIVHLDSARIMYYFKALRGATSLTEESMFALKSKIAGTLCSPSDRNALAAFLEWLAHLSTVQAMPIDSGPDSLVDLVRWALQAKRTYLNFLRFAFFPDGQRPPTWIYTILKLGRYAIAARALIQLALEIPSLFNPMIVESLSAPPKTRFKCPEGEAPLTSVLRRVVGGREIDMVSRLARVWDVSDAEAHFRKACTLDLWVHAEVQLASFYDQYPERKPAFRFVGVSKKSCFLCEKFLSNHPHTLTVSSCHRKLYLSWRPPPTTDSKIYRKYKAMTANLSRDMEEVAKQDLDSRLGIRRSIPLDSTAGVSLSGLTDVDSATKGAASRPRSSSVTGARVSEQSGATLSTQPITVIDLTPQDDELPRISGSVEDLQIRPLMSIPTIVFHITRANNTNKQDIVAITDIIDPLSGNPSWRRLVGILVTGGELGVDFTEGEDFLMVGTEEPIRVATERQFMACVTFLRNLRVSNIKVSVYNYAEVSPSGVRSSGDQPADTDGLG